MIDNIKWEAVTQGTVEKSYKVQNTLGRKPKMLLKAPEDCKYKRAWHFWKLFPKKELEYCCNRAMEEALGADNFVPFDAAAFFAAWFTSRRLGIGHKLGYRKDLVWANQTDPGRAFGKIPRQIYQVWHRYLCGNLPIDRELFLGCLTGARDREFAVCRLKSKMLKNCRDAREPPVFFVCDEQLCPYFGHTSGLKKRLPKKKIEGIEYFSLAVSNKHYEGYRFEERAEPEDGELKGKIVRQADPVCGGYKLHYIMSPGARYDAGSPNLSKAFGTMLLLIFMCGGYLRYRNTCAITDSAYGFVEAMMYISL